MSEINTVTISLDKYAELQKIEEAYKENKVVIYQNFMYSRAIATADYDEKLADLAEMLSGFQEDAKKYNYKELTLWPTQGIYLYLSIR